MNIHEPASCGPVLRPALAELAPAACFLEPTSYLQTAFVNREKPALQGPLGRRSGHSGEDGGVGQQGLALSLAR